jgi:basic membrane protein A
MTIRTRRNPRSTRALVGVIATFALATAACGGDDEETDGTAEAGTEDAAGDTAEAPAATEPAAEATEPPADEPAPEPTEPAPTTAGGAAPAEGRVIPGQPDVNGDGRIVVGLLSGGDTTDGGYFQSLVDETAAFVEEQGDPWEYINVDQVTAADARQQIENLLAQGVDIFALGGGDLLYPQLREVAAEPAYENVAFVVTGAQDRTPDANVTSMTDNNDDISFSAGVAAAIALQERGETKAGIIGFDGSDPFVVATNAMRAGLLSVLPDAELVVSTVGPNPDDVAASTEAARQMIAQGVGVIYPFLGAGSNAVIEESNAAGVDVFATAADRCAEDGIDVFASIRFTPGTYFRTSLEQFAAGEFVSGIIYEAQLGKEAVGAILCDPTPEQQDQIDAVYEAIQSGEIDPEALRMEQE